MMEEHLRGIGMTSQRARDRLVKRLGVMGIRSEQVLEAVRRTPRHYFVDEALASRAYENTALPIGYGQTISQPYIVARMTETLVDSGSLNKVLEVGGGCGYQTAILAGLAERVYTIERIRPLADRLRDRVSELHLNNVMVRHGDGNDGWPECAPFDAILVAAAPAGLPEALSEQLTVGGRLIIPLGDQQLQQLVLFERGTRGIRRTALDTVKFVPMLKGTG
jgi:protein-L-isoaspartate(D-aspartate) O-methyltransferase